MKVLTNIANFLGFYKRENTNVGPSPAPTPRAGEGFPWLNASAGAMNVATAYRCVNILADSVANLPINLKRRKGDIFANDINSGNLWYLLNVQPDYYLSAVDFWRQVVQYVLLRGNSYIVPVRDVITPGRYSRLVLVNPSCVAHDTMNDTYTVNDMEAGISGVYAESEIIHIKNFTHTGKVGVSTISFARLTLDIAQTGDRETLDRFENGGIVRGLVGNDAQAVRGFGEYQTKELQKTAEDLDEKFRAGKRVVNLPGSVNFQPVTATAADMQFLETRKFSVRDICRFFGVHPSFVFDDTSNNYKSAEMANVAFLSNTLNPLLRKIEVELLRKLVAPSRAADHRFEFDRSGLYACDLDSKTQYQTSLLQAGLATVNELRAMENRPAVANGDKTLVSANLKTIDELTNPNTNNTPDNTDGQE